MQMVRKQQSLKKEAIITFYSCSRILGDIFILNLVTVRSSFLLSLLRGNLYFSAQVDVYFHLQTAFNIVIYEYTVFFLLFEATDINCSSLSGEMM